MVDLRLAPVEGDDAPLMDRVLKEKIDRIVIEKEIGPIDANSVRLAFECEGGIYFAFDKKEREYVYANGKVRGPFYDTERLEWYHGALLIYANDNVENDILIYRGEQYGPEMNMTTLFGFVENLGFVVVCEREKGEAEGPIFLNGKEMFCASHVDVESVGVVGGELTFIAKKDGKQICYCGGVVKPFTRIIAENT